MLENMTQLEPFLDDLEARLDPAVEEALEAQWLAFTNHGAGTPVFSPRRPAAAPPRIDWPGVSLNDTLGDDEQAFTNMACQQLHGCSNTLAGAGGSLLCVRSNYGTGILPSLFGAPIQLMDRHYETLPGALPLPGGLDAIRRVVAEPLPRHEAGWGARVFEMGRRFRALLDSRPNTKRFIHLYHPDLQGPLDVAELLVGSDIFCAFYDEPELIHALLAKITGTYETVLDAWLETARPVSRGWSAHWGAMHKGLIMLRLDSGMNLSPEMIAEFSLPYDARLLKRYGGAMHSCGRVDHFFGLVAALEGCHGLNLSQPSYNDMEKVYAETIDARDVRFLNHPRDECRRLIAAGRATHGRVQG